MTLSTTMPARRKKLSPASTDVLAACAATIGVFLIHVAAGLPTLHGAEGDNDSLLRLVQVRDLVAGQGWFDLHQYRMGLPGGFEMHWSRLVDAPIAAIFVVVSALTGSNAAAEATALVLWPLLLLGVALFLTVHAARTTGGDEAVLPGVVLGAAALYFGGQFAPAMIDHHNVQLVLALAMIVALLHGGKDNHGGATAGTCAALMLAVGMETAPYIAAAGAFVAIAFLVNGEAERRTAIGFGLAFAAVCAAAFLATVPWRAWGTVRCDALSVAQLVVAAVAGAGLAIAASIPLAGRTARFAALAALGGGGGAVALVFFPQCLADPYAGLDPRLRTHWMNSITEAQPLWSLLGDDPATAVKYYVTPLLGLAVLALRVKGKGPERMSTLLGLFLLTAVLVSMWQVRGAMFSIPFAVIPLAAWVGAWRRRAAGNAPRSAILEMATAWLVSINVTWAAAAAFIPAALDANAPEAPRADKCQDADDYADLATLPAGGVLAVANLGAPILRYTTHRVLAGLYHRNIEANLLALSAFGEPAATAAALVRRQNLAYVVICPGDGETASIANKAPSGFIAAMLKGDVPDWLEPVADGADKPLRIFRVVPDK